MIIKRPVHIPSKNLGVFCEDGKLQFCVVKFKENSSDLETAVAITTKKEINPTQVETLSSLFNIKSNNDGGIYGDKISNIETNKQSQILSTLKTKKSVSLLLKMSIYKQDIDWYTEDEGVFVVEIEKDKTLPLSKVKKYEDKINKLEQAYAKKMQAEFER